MSIAASPGAKILLGGGGYTPPSELNFRNVQLSSVLRHRRRNTKRQRTEKSENANSKLLNSVEPKGSPKSHDVEAAMANDQSAGNKEVLAKVPLFGSAVYSPLFLIHP